ncbi:MAG TPA: hypothetical protein VHN15_12120 [Thermoanaerobaculia bacterium]|nr:hypothetical protein [Thermoanaerobaculia bacterium]
MSERRGLVLRWYVPLLAGLVPVLLLGFLYSALADRLAFVYWALAVAVVWTVLLRHVVAAGWSGPGRAGALALLLALAFAAFAALEKSHGEILDLGFRAALPGLYHPAATRPATAGVVAGALAVAGAASLLVGSLRRKTA